MLEHLDRDALSDYLRGELDAQSEANIEEHIGSCLVCARTLQAEAQLEEMLHETAAAMSCGDTSSSEDAAWSSQRPPVWRRVAATAAVTAAAAAALLFVLVPSAQRGHDTHSIASLVESPTVPSAHSAFINDSPLCFPAVEEAEVCVEPLAVVTTTDPDDYLSPYDPDHRHEQRGAGLNACLDEDLTCDPFAG